MDRFPLGGWAGYRAAWKGGIHGKSAAPTSPPFGLPFLHQSLLEGIGDKLGNLLLMICFFFLLNHISKKKKSPLKIYIKRVKRKAFAHTHLPELAYVLSP